MKRMHDHTWIVLVFALAGASPALGQEDDPPPISPERMQEVKAQKSAYITSKLQLTTEEAQLFWPIYNEMDRKQDAIRTELRELHRDGKNDLDLTEAEAAQMIQKGLEIRQKELDLERAYAERFKKSIGSLKTLRLRKAERDFNREVLRRYRERMEDRHGAGGEGPPRRP